MTLSRGQAGVAMDYFAMDGGSPGGAHGTRRGGAARRGRRRTYSGGDSSVPGWKSHGYFTMKAATGYTGRCCSVCMGSSVVAMYTKPLTARMCIS